jgi:hypothetical protein
LKALEYDIDIKQFGMICVASYWGKDARRAGHYLRPACEVAIGADLGRLALVAAIEYFDERDCISIIMG